MTPEEIAKLVYKYHNIPWVMHDRKDNHREVARAKHDAIYLIRHFNPKMSLTEIGNIFDVKHCNVMYVLDKIANNTHLYAEDRKRIGSMMKNIRSIMGIKDNAYSTRMQNKRIIVIKYWIGENEAYEIRLRRLVEKRNIEEVSFTLSEDAYKAIIHSYKILNL